MQKKIRFYCNIFVVKLFYFLRNRDEFCIKKGKIGTKVKIYEIGEKG